MESQSGHYSDFEERYKDMESSVKPPHKRENPLFSILFNILLPVLILNNLTTRLGDQGPLYALLLALSLPITYGLVDYFKNRQKNLISILGIINTVSTGGLALMQLEGIWFAIKEALFPLLIGMAVFVSAYTTKPFIKIVSGHFLNMPLINERLEGPQKGKSFQVLLRNSTLIFALSFLISSLLNFFLALWIFQDIDPSLAETEKAAILNAQVSKMTWMGYVVIALPLTAMMAFNIWYLIRGIGQITQLPTMEILKQPPN